MFVQIKIVLRSDKDLGIKRHEQLHFFHEALKLKNKDRQGVQVRIGLQEYRRIKYTRSDWFLHFQSLLPLDMHQPMEPMGETYFVSD